MKNSLKFLMVAFCALFMVGQANAVQYYDDSHSALIALRENQHVFSFIPRDIRSIQGIQANKAHAYYKCAEDGTEVIYDRGRHTVARGSKKLFGACSTYYSRSTNTSWVVSFTPASAGQNSSRATQIHELKHGQLRLWATFDPRDHDRNTYASAGAQRFAERNGDRNADVAQSPNEPGNNEVAQAPQPAKENCAGKNFFEKAACELKNAGVENAVGTILNKSR